jgi:hypothetical protein
MSCYNLCHVRFLHQELERQAAESKLMSFEDFMFSGSVESKLRVMRAEDRTKVGQC